MFLQPERLTLSAEELDFFRKQLGTEDEAEIKAHIFKVATDAYEVYSYGCIGEFVFVKTKSLFYDRYDPDLTYRAALRLCSEREGGLYLDYGCCFGVDLRKAVSDGLPVQKAIGVDIHPEFWDLGHALFRSSSETFPVAFVRGNAFDPSFVAGKGPCTQIPKTDPPDLKSLTSLAPLQGRISAIHTALVFHLFGRDEQLELARVLSSLLSPTSGSVIFGCQAGKTVAGDRVNFKGEIRFSHSPESWEELWNGQVFPAGSVRVKSKLIPVPAQEYNGVDAVLLWSCTIL
ncbi:hypothetical protein V5O48_005710 [Marasmius crinis-equi]|uniref:Methyltransferase domain-containing protein n=1 Tax=Marasmius crinis-equi TaxID=585013 RepID=A0ABR3FLJ9_9AGAR